MQPDPHPSSPLDAGIPPPAPATAPDDRTAIRFTKAIHGRSHVALRLASPVFLVLFATAQLIAGDGGMATGAFVVAAVAGALDWWRWRNDIVEADVVGDELRWRTPTAEGTWPVADLRIQGDTIPFMAPRLTRSDGVKTKYLGRGEGRDELLAHVRRHATGVSLSQWTWRHR